MQQEGAADNHFFILPLSAELLSEHFDFNKSTIAIALEEKILAAEFLLSKGLPYDHYPLFLVKESELTSQPTNERINVANWKKQGNTSIYTRHVITPLAEECYLILKTDILKQQASEECELWSNATETSSDAFNKLIAKHQLPTYEASNLSVRQHNKLLLGGTVQPQPYLYGLFINSTNKNTTDFAFETHRSQEEQNKERLGTAYQKRILIYPRYTNTARYLTPYQIEHLLEVRRRTKQNPTTIVSEPSTSINGKSVEHYKPQTSTQDHTPTSETKEQEAHEQAIDTFITQVQTYQKSTRQPTLPTHEQNSTQRKDATTNGSNSQELPDHLLHPGKYKKRTPDRFYMREYRIQELKRQGNKKHTS